MKPSVCASDHGIGPSGNCTTCLRLLLKNKCKNEILVDIYFSVDLVGNTE